MGVGASGSEGVANTLKSSLNSIGYVELDYALTKGIPIALVKNRTGNFIAPSLDSTHEAVSNAVALNSFPKGDKSWTRVSMLKAPGPRSYPIASFSYLILYKEMSTIPSLDQTKAKALVNFISWAITDGQKLAATLGYAPLPARVVKGDQDTLRLLSFRGTPLYTRP
jgi:phosphate transport system substrate-binding protein